MDHCKFELGVLAFLSEHDKILTALHKYKRVLDV